MKIKEFFKKLFTQCIGLKILAALLAFLALVVVQACVL